jgi:hypothetical protein
MKMRNSFFSLFIVSLALHGCDSKKPGARLPETYNQLSVNEFEVFFYPETPEDVVITFFDFFSSSVMTENDLNAAVLANQMLSASARQLLNNHRAGFSGRLIILAGEKEVPEGGIKIIGINTLKENSVLVETRWDYHQPHNVLLAKEKTFSLEKEGEYWKISSIQ